MARLAIRVTSDKSDKETIKTGDKKIKACVYFGNKKDALTLLVTETKEKEYYYQLTRPTEDGHAVIGCGMYRF